MHEISRAESATSHAAPHLTSFSFLPLNSTKLALNQHNQHPILANQIIQVIVGFHRAHSPISQQFKAAHENSRAHECNLASINQELSSGSLLTFLESQDRDFRSL